MRRYTYDMVGWRFAHSSPDTIDARPGILAFVRRLVPLALSLGLAWGLHAMVDAGREPVFVVVLGLADALVALGLAWTAMAFWQRLSIAREGDLLVIYPRVFFPQRVALNLDRVRGLGLLASEARTSRRTGRQLLGSRWAVQIVAEDAELKFWIHEGRDTGGGDSAPPEVTRFVRAIEGLTGIACGKPQRIRRGGGVEAGYRTGGTTVTVSSVSYSGLDEMPDEVRRKAEAYLDEMRARGATRGQFEEYRVIGADGQETVYGSLDEMPADLRQRFEAARRSGSTDRER